MSDVIVRSELPSASGLAADKFTNTFAFTDVDLEDVDSPSGILQAVRAFYTEIPAGGLIALSDRMSEEISDDAGAWAIKAYDATGHLSGTSSMGAPIWQINPTFPTSADPRTPLPAEVAVCITLEALGRSTSAVETADGGDAGTERDRPMQRHTGRIYLGPLNTQAIAEVSGQARPDESVLDTARLAVVQLRDSAYVDGAGAKLAVWSRKDATMRIVTDVSVDNSFDVIRSRGPAPTTRQRSAVA